MRFAIILSAFAAVTSVLGGNTQTRSTKVIRAQPVTPRTHSLFERQGVVDLNLCLNLGVNPVALAVKVPGLNALVQALPIIGPIVAGKDVGEVANVELVVNICLCLANGLLTPASVARLRQTLVAQAKLETSLLGGLVTVDLKALVPIDLLTTLVGNAILELVGRTPTPAIDCGFKANAIPDSCTSCTYTCPPEFPVKCDRGCRTGACPTGLSTTRRSRSFDVKLVCPVGLTACGLPNQVNSFWGKVECLETQQNVESCGGCEYPLPGMPRGVDCTAINNTDSVSCIAGTCVVGSCQRGYALVEGICVRVGLTKQSRS